MRIDVNIQFSHIVIGLYNVPGRVHEIEINDCVDLSNIANVTIRLTGIFINSHLVPEKIHMAQLYTVGMNILHTFDIISVSNFDNGVAITKINDCLVIERRMRGYNYSGC